jgi:hypothetical protein
LAEVVVNSLDEVKTTPTTRYWGLPQTSWPWSLVNIWWTEYSSNFYDN